MAWFLGYVTDNDLSKFVKPLQASAKLKGGEISEVAFESEFKLVILLKLIKMILIL